MTPSLPTTDPAWDAQYPATLQGPAEFHFSPLATVERAAQWLTEVPHGRIVDLGAGAGKFCVAAAAQYPRTEFVGIERREALVEEAERWRARHDIPNCSFEVGDASAIALATFTGAYVYNPFYEHVDPSDGLPGALELGRAAYEARCLALRQNLSRVHSGFRLVTYFCYGPEIPATFVKTWEAEEGKLVGWVA